jgi:hypothetical protein
MRQSPTKEAVQGPSIFEDNGGATAQAQLESCETEEDEIATFLSRDDSPTEGLPPTEEEVDTQLPVDTGLASPHRSKELFINVGNSPNENEGCQDWNDTLDNQNGTDIDDVLSFLKDAVTQG